jgi:MoxR-like ATPase
MPLKILSKKRWHVWNQDNVERVLKDERLHREAEEAKQQQTVAAEHESRIAALKAKYVPDCPFSLRVLVDKQWVSNANVI